MLNAMAGKEAIVSVVYTVPGGILWYPQFPFTPPPPPPLIIPYRVTLYPPRERDINAHLLFGRIERCEGESTMLFSIT